MKRDPNWKRRKDIIFCRCYDTYVENPKDAIRKQLELINNFSNIAGYQINTQKSLAFLYTDKKRPEIEIQEIIISFIASKRIK